MSFIHLFEAWNVFVVVLNRKNNVCLNNLNQSCSWGCSVSTVLLNLTSLTKRKKGANSVHWGRPREERASTCSSFLNVSITTTLSALECRLLFLFKLIIVTVNLLSCFPALTYTTGLHILSEHLFPSYVWHETVSFPYYEVFTALKVVKLFFFYTGWQSVLCDLVEALC